MTIKQYKIIKLAVVIIIAFIFSQSVIAQNFFIPVATLVVSALILLFLRRRVSGVMADERDYQSGGRAAILAIQIYSWVAVIFMFWLYSMQDTNPDYEAIAIALAFSTCILLLLYSFIFTYYNKFKLTNKKFLYGGLIVLVMIILLLLTLRVFSGEDNWICKNGEWIKHGQPDWPAPTVECK